MNHPYDDAILRNREIELRQAHIRRQAADLRDDKVNPLRGWAGLALISIGRKIAANRAAQADCPPETSVPRASRRSRNALAPLEPAVPESDLVV